MLFVVCVQYKKENLPEKILFLALENVAYDESRAILLISKMLKDDAPKKVRRCLPYRMYLYRTAYRFSSSPPHSERSFSCLLCDSDLCINDTDGFCWQTCIWIRIFWGPSNTDPDILGAIKYGSGYSGGHQIWIRIFWGPSNTDPDSGWFDNVAKF